MDKDIDYISSVVRAFYEKAKSDIIIGYHFRHIENFDEHIPKIIRFWCLQLLDLPKEKIKEFQKEGTPNQIIKKHMYLKIKKGEVGRWVLLFQETIDQHPSNELSKNWSSLVLKWKKNFLNAEDLFS